MGLVKEQMMEEQEKERNFKMEEAEHDAIIAGVDFSDSLAKLVDITKPVTYNKETMQIENVKKEPIGICQYCNEEIFDDEDSDEGHTVSTGDESITICESCFDHLN
jgi:hypothetical protein